MGITATGIRLTKVSRWRHDLRTLSEVGGGGGGGGGGGPESNAEFCGFLSRWSEQRVGMPVIRERT